MGLSIAQRLALLPGDVRTRWLSEQTSDVIREMRRGEWWYTARPEQVPPPGDWMIALYMAGRGAGKSRSGSEWLVEQVLKHPYDRHGVGTEWSIIAETLADARLICIEGPSGVLNVLDRREIKYRYKQSPKSMILIGDSRIHTLGADDEDVARGSNLSGVWLDEIAKWLLPYESWYHGIMPALRADLVNDHPRAFVTTTPKPVKLLIEWMGRDDGSVHIISGSTFDNAANLSPHVLRELEKRYGGTALGQQELYGKILELTGGGIFKRMDIVKHRVSDIPDDIVATVVGMDPSLTGEDDLTGIVVMARTVKDHLYVLADRTVPSAGRAAAMAAWRTVADYGADTLCYEENLGKRYLQEVLRDAYLELVKEGVFPQNTSPPMKPIHAKHGKKTRAEPVAMRAEQGRFHIVGEFAELEDEMVTFDPESSSKESPDRMDAMVHAAIHLMAGERRRMRIARPQDYAFDLGQNFYDLSRLA